MRKTLFLLSLMALAPVLSAFPVFYMPAVRIQPDGDTLRLFVTGDEYYHRFHDANNYTIVQNPRTGYWVYSAKSFSDGNRWTLVPTDYVAGRVDPASVGLQPNIGVDRQTWLEKQHFFDIPDSCRPPQPKTSGRNHGTLNNIVIFIRFSDDQNISTPFSTINSMFNDSSAASTSMYSYFRTASYGKVSIPTFYFPTPSGNSVLSFQDSLPRSYYVPYNATTNPNGYHDDTERREREFDLLERAVNYVNANSPVPSSLNIDWDNDGLVDNICFVLKGTYTGWSDLLWPHKWSLWDRYVYINGKRVYTFNLQLEGSGSHYFGSSTFCHEMFHSLGAPDLYHYDDDNNVSGVGGWDLMCSNSDPPQHMGAYMKWRYGNWIDSVPEITIPGTYSLHSVGDPAGENICYKIAAQEPHQWYVLEYRDNTERFETALPGKGLLIYRIDDRFSGNAGFNGVDQFDEVYLFRPGANDDSTNGNLNLAYFSGTTPRTSFNLISNPHPWLTGNILDTTFSITNVTDPGITISFTYNDLRGCREPLLLSTSNVTGTSAHLTWSGNAGSYLVQLRQTDSPVISALYTTTSSIDLTNLSLYTGYEWRVQGICGAGDSSAFSQWTSFVTTSCPLPVADTLAQSDTSVYYIPVNAYYNYTYSQMIYSSSEIGSEKNISKIAFNYAYATPLTTKTNCTIYMGNTSQSQFAGEEMTNFVPFSQLHKVYTGSLNSVQGWNWIELDSAFHYNGTDNLVIAIDDNSGAYNGSYYHFYCTSTGNKYRSLTFYSDNSNPDPTQSSFSGNKKRMRMRPDIVFEGCPPYVPPPTYTVNVSTLDAGHGTVDGAGQYTEGDTAVISAYAAENYRFAYWLAGTPASFDTIFDNPYTFTVTSDTNFIACFEPTLFTVELTAIGGGTLHGAGLYTYGTYATVSITPPPHYHFVRWTSTPNGTTAPDGDTITLNPYTFQVTGDITLTACSELDLHSLTIAVTDTTAGTAWFEINNGTAQGTQAQVPFASSVTLHARPCEGYRFDGWGDGSLDSVRVVLVMSDTSFTAGFSALHPVGSPDPARQQTNISVNRRTITLSGVEGRTVALCDILGRPVSTLVSPTPTLTLTVPAPGIYLLRIDKNPAQKIIVN